MSATVIDRLTNLLRPAAVHAKEVSVPTPPEELPDSTPGRYPFADLPRTPVYTVTEAEAMMEAFQARMDDPTSDVTIPEISERMVTIIRHLHWDDIEEEREFILRMMLADRIPDEEVLEYLTEFIRYGLKEDFTPNATAEELGEMSRPVSKNPKEAKDESLDFAALLHWIKDSPYHDSFRTVMSLRYEAPSPYHGSHEET